MNWSINPALKDPTLLRTCFTSYDCYSGECCSINGFCGTGNKIINLGDYFCENKPISHITYGDSY